VAANVLTRPLIAGGCGAGSGRGAAAARVADAGDPGDSSPRAERVIASALKAQAPQTIRGCAAVLSDSGVTRYPARILAFGVRRVACRTRNSDQVRFLLNTSFKPSLCRMR